MPMPPLTMRAPVVVLVEGTKGAPMLPMMTLPRRLLLPVMFKFPPMYVLPLMPTPPFTTNVPVEMLVDGTYGPATLPTKMLPTMAWEPTNTMLPPILTFPAMPTPPATINAPVVVELDDVVLFTYTLPALKLTSPVNVLDDPPPPDPTKLP